MIIIMSCTTHKQELAMYLQFATYSLIPQCSHINPLRYFI